jgi:large subunit ribosomal protein L13
MSQLETQVFKTFMPEQKEPGWVLIDAEGQSIGRVASLIASVLRGKHKPDFTPNMATGDCVVVLNADKVVLKGSKPRTKLYTRYSGYPGGLKVVKGADMLAEKPVKAVEHAVKGMLPKGTLGYTMFRRLKVYTGTAHPHAAQKPVKMEVK